MLYEGCDEKAARILVSQGNTHNHTVELEAPQCERFLSAIRTRFMLIDHSFDDSTGIFHLELKEARGGLTACWPPSFCAPYSNISSHHNRGPLPVPEPHVPAVEYLTRMRTPRRGRIMRAATWAFGGIPNSPLHILEIRARLNCANSVPVVLSNFRSNIALPPEACILELPLRGDHDEVGTHVTYIEKTHRIMYICRPATHQHAIYLYAEPISNSYATTATPTPVPVFGASAVPMNWVDAMHRVAEDTFYFKQAIKALSHEIPLYTNVMRVLASANIRADVDMVVQRRREEVLGISSIESELVALFNKKQGA